MDLQNLHAASTYVNNLLLSRGLLRDGTPIQFAKPSKGEGGANATMAQIINLVHDLVLRRDRETDTLTTLSQNMQTLRTTTAQQSQNITRLETRGTDLERQLALSLAQERAAKASLRTADNRNRALKEDMAKLKLSVTQIRSQCANDIRKRDSEIKRLKRHLEGRRGRDGTSGQVGVMVITPGAHKSQPSSLPANPAAGTENPAYSLKQETNAFLTALTQSLADENDALTSLIQTTLSTLRHLQGLPSSDDPSAGSAPGNPNVTLLTPPSYEILEADTTAVLSHLRSILTNPSFVPLEEVEIREDEIRRLHAGWEKMEARWRGAVAMMDGWRKRMVETGDTINLEDLRRGLTLDEEVAPSSSNQGDDSIDAAEAADGSLVSGGNQSLDSERDADEEEREDTPSPQLKHPVPAAREIGVGLFPALNILRPFSGNARRPPSPCKQSPQQDLPVPFPASEVDQLETFDSLSLEYDSTPSKKKVKPGRSDFDLGEPPLSVQQKLALAEQEAGRVRKRLLAKGDGAKNTVSGERKTGLPRAKAGAGRRRSTLSPEELEGLMGLG